MRKTVLVTGGAYGIGRAICARFLGSHALALTWCNTPPDPARGEQPDVLAMRADLTQPGAAQAVVEDTMARFGRLDVIVNNAGAVAQSPPDAFDAEAQRAILDLNLLAPQALLSAALPHLQPGASVVSISSVNAVLPPRGAATYGASKAALNLWTRAMAKELGPRGIRVNAVAPGAVNVPESPRDAALTKLFTDETALGRLASAEDIAQAVFFLASDAARSITGEVLTVSAGYRL
ncbi:SDR family NAD(P)-dependent oxidoreductase [Cribrihabitans neustonicus]|uniref:SDR family NAD(P)-dependent oxidoreductase n=1 Tax=Cribrihabitans neustonicus TaxID=1429085 RepID=UPI003B5B47E2